MSDGIGIASPAEYIRYCWPNRHNAFTRMMIWNAIGAERRHRIRQADRYPYGSRFTVPAPKRRPDHALR